MEGTSAIKKSWDCLTEPKNVMIDSLEGELQFEASHRIKGKLNVTECNDIYLFEWTPDKCEEFSLPVCNVEESRFYFFLQFLQSIQVTQTSTHTIVRFLVPKLPNSCSFKFEDPTKILILLEELKVKEMLVPNANFDEILDVRVKHNCELELTGCALTLTQAICYHAHRVLLEKWKVKQARMDGVAVEDVREHVQKDGTIRDFQELKKKIFANGLSPEARPVVWPYLSGVYAPGMTTDEKRKEDDRRFQEYKVMAEQAASIIGKQRLYDTTSKVIDQDTARPGKTLEYFRSPESPARSMVSRIFKVFDKYDQDTGYLQGMPDMAYVLFKVFVKDVSKDKVVMFDDSEWDVLRAESFLFWNFIGMMKASGQDGLFHDMFNNLPFVAERAFAIAKDHHPVMTNWLAAQKLSRLSFLDNAFMIQFSRSYQLDVVVNIWDRIYSAERPYGFIRFMVAALLFYVFPEIVLESQAQFDAVKPIKHTDGMTVLALAMNFHQAATRDAQHEQLTDWYFMEVPSPHTPVLNYPRYFRLWEPKE